MDLGSFDIFESGGGGGGGSCCKKGCTFQTDVNYKSIADYCKCGPLFYSL